MNDILEQEKELRKLLEKRSSSKGQKLQENFAKFEKKVKKDKIKLVSATPPKVEYDTGICRFSVREIDDRYLHFHLKTNKFSSIPS